MILRKNPLASLWLRRLAPASGLLLGLLGLALRLYRLGAQSLWLDEGGTWAEVSGRSGKGWLALLGELFSKDAAYPLYHIMLKAWLGLAGDSEWALRFPSALAGAAAVVVVYLAAQWIDTPAAGARSSRRPLIAGLLLATAPFALWQSQDAKVYSLLMLCAALLMWALLRALRTRSARDWAMLLGVALINLFVHRLALLTIAGALAALGLLWPFGGSRWAALWRWGCGLAGLVCAGAAIYGTVRAVGAESRGGTGHIPAGPASGLWLSFTHFALDRGNIGGWLGLPLLAWALPALALSLWGLALLLRDARRGSWAAIALLCMLWVPLLLFAVALGFAQLFESRYVTAAFPAWVLLLAYPFREPQNYRAGDQETRKPGASHLRFLSRLFAGRSHQTQSAMLQFAPGALLAALLLVNGLVLLQPQHGLYSGAPVKEQWREGIAALAARAHPDDLVILHPYYVQIMWDYYAPRVTPDPLPQLTTFDLLGQGYCRDVAQDDQAKLIECYRRSYEEAFDRAAAGRKRMLMLIAPDHARTIDPPKTLAELQADYQRDPRQFGGQPPTQADRYGFLGLRFQYSSQQRSWPCGGTGDALIGVELMCASFPSFYQQKGAASIPQPASRLDARFGGELHLRGYSLDLLGGMARPGGTLPVTLYWDAIVPPTHDYQMFLHLCRDCDRPPLASDGDSPPLQGYFPAGKTSTWKPGDPVHDERNLALPADLPPGRYTLLLGVYPSGDPAEQARLQVSSADAPVLGGTRLVLGQVTIGP